MLSRQLLPCPYQVKFVTGWGGQVVRIQHTFAVKENTDQVMT
ncbi:Sulfurtransferase tusD [Yersinia intermedia ATCC 29909]|nr:Sulfurtransferase tusD [Yersinia intermedia ATCC 29909]